jgi:ABC-type Mn2+/Zn2+ transport system permease subunit
MIFADRSGTRLAIEWPMGTLVPALGVHLSVLLDTPTGATVCPFGAVLIVMLCICFCEGSSLLPLEKRA